MTQQHRPGVFGGVDTHKHTHVAAAVDGAGRVLGTAAFGADAAGYAELLGWLRGCGSVERVGVEGTGSYGAGLARCLAQAGVDVVDVNRPNRQLRRRRGKTDTVDAQAAALAALSGSAAVVPKSADGCVEAIRVLSVARRSAVKARTVAANQIGAVVVTAPEQVKDRLRALNTARTVEACARLRPGAGCDPVLAAAKQALRCLARRHQALTAEIKHLDTELRRLCERANPALLSACGVGAETAASLLVAAGDNPERMHSEASFAALCGTSPVEASSGPRTVRHRLNRGGNRRKPTTPCGASRWSACASTSAASPTPRASPPRARPAARYIRCLKRHIAREVYKLITDPPDVVHGADLRRQRTQRRLTINQTAQALGAAPTRISALERGAIHNRDLAERYQRYLAQIAS